MAGQRFVSLYQKIFAEPEQSFSTIGINGLNEAILNFTDGKENIVSQWGQDFAEEVLLFMRNKLREYRRKPAIFTILKPRWPKAPLTVLPKRTRKFSPA